MRPADVVSQIDAELIGLEIIPPVAYSSWWLVLSGLLVLLATAWIVVALIRTRAPRTPAAPGVPVADLRTDHLERIRTIRRRVRSGELLPRSGHQALSVIVRDYVQQVSGAPVATMTLAQLRELAASHAPAPVGPDGTTGPGLSDLAELVDALYPPEFGPSTPGLPSAPGGAASFDVAADRAERLVHAWV